MTEGGFKDKNIISITGKKKRERERERERSHSIQWEKTVQSHSREEENVANAGSEDMFMWLINGVTAGVMLNFMST